MLVLISQRLPHFDVLFPIPHFNSPSSFMLKLELVSIFNPRYHTN